MYDTDLPSQYDLLSDSEKSNLCNWIRNNLVPIKSFNTSITSYGLKHLMEHDNPDLCFYNGAFKGAMLSCGFKVKDKNSTNWVFNISNRSLSLIKQRLEFK